MIRHLNRWALIGMIKLLLALIIFHTGCKEMHTDKIQKREYKRYIDDQIVLPTKIATKEASISTPQIEPNYLASGNNATSEMLLATGEWEYATREESYISRTTFMREKPKLKAKKIVRLFPGTKVEIMPKSIATSEWAYVESGKDEGYVQREKLCAEQLCIRKKRCGLVEVFIRAEKLVVPQVQFKVINLLPENISNFRMNGKFYYQGELIGEDEAYISLESLGLKAIGTGDSRTVFMRPYYELAPTDILSPENPVEVELQCAIGGYNYMPCGMHLIDSMVY